MRNHSLVLNLATDNDEGYYMCQATNEIGAGLKKVIRINVNGNLIREFNLTEIIIFFSKNSI